MAEQQLDIIIRTLLEGNGLQATRENIDAVTASIKNLNGAGNLELFRGVIEGMEKEISAIHKRKDAAAEQAFGKAMQAEAATVDAALKKEIKALEDYEKARDKAIAQHEAKQNASNQKARTNYVDGLEEGRQKKVLEELKRAQEATNEEEEKGTGKKKEAMEAAKGLALENSHLGQAVRLLQSPFALVGAAAGFAIKWMMDYSRAVDRAAESSEAFARASGPIDQVALSLRQMKAEDAALDQFFKHQVASANSIERAYREANEQIALTAQLTAKVDQAALQKALAEIDDDDTLSSAAKIQKKFKITEDAKAKKLADDEQRRADEQAARHVALNKSAFAAVMEERKAAEFKPAIARQSQDAENAAKSLADTEKEAAARADFIKRAAPLLREFAGGKVERLDALAGSQNVKDVLEGGTLGIKIPERADMLRDPSLAAKALEEMKDREDLDKNAVTRARLVSEAEAAKLTNLKNERDFHTSKAKEERANSEKLGREWQLGEIRNPQIRAAEAGSFQDEHAAGSRRTGRAVRDAQESELSDRGQKLQSMRQADQSGEPQKFVQAVTRATGAMAGTVGDAIALMRKFEEESLNHRREIEEMYARAKNTRPF